MCKNVQNEVTIRLNRSIERKYKRANKKRMMATEKNAPRASW